MGKTLLFIPTYNERENVDPMCKELLALGLDADIVFMDDNSPDGTGDLLDALAKAHPRVSVIHRSGKLGIGGAHKDGIAWAYDHGYETLVTMDCDFTHSPADVPRLLEHSREYDLVIGSRYLAEGSLPGWSLVRRGLTNLGHWTTLNVLGISGDATGAFRCYRLTTIPREMFDIVESRGYSFFYESLFVAHQNGFRIHEVPIRLPARTYGHSKMSVGEVQRSIAGLFSLYAKSKANPAQFRVGAPLTEVDPTLVDPQGWDEYWEKKRRKSALAYELVASAYRNIFIKAGLTGAIRKEFPKGSTLLHAGCGSGQVDADLHTWAKITAVDISVPALELYRRENPSAFAVKHASIFSLPFPDASFDGVYNLGVVEHFHRPELTRIFAEFKRVLKPGGKVLLFWPHAHATSVMVLNSIHFVLNDVLKKGTRLHPPEVSLVHGESEAKDILSEAGFQLESYDFGPKDLFIQAIVTARPL